MILAQFYKIFFFQILQILLILMFLNRFLKYKKKEEFATYTRRGAGLGIVFLFGLNIVIYMWVIAKVNLYVAQNNFLNPFGSGVLFVYHVIEETTIFISLFIAIILSIIITSYISIRYHKIVLDSLPILPIKLILCCAGIYFSGCLFYREIGFALTNDKIKFKSARSDNLTILLISEIVSIDKTNSGYLVTQLKNNKVEMLNIPFKIIPNEKLLNNAIETLNLKIQNTKNN